MNYNNKFYSDEIELILPKLQNFNDKQKHILDFLKRYLLAGNGLIQKNYCAIFFELLVKIRFNLDSIILLFPGLDCDYRYKNSINVLYRTIVDDIIGICYLFCFLSTTDNDQELLGNELKILEKESSRSIILGLMAQYEFDEYRRSIMNIPSEAMPDFKANAKILSPYLFQDNDFKSNDILRTIKSVRFEKHFNLTSRDGFISETQKLNVMKIANFQTVSNIKFLFKYFSQFQHFSSISHDMSNASITFDLMLYQDTLKEIVLLISQLFRVLNLQDNMKLQLECEQLMHLVFDPI